MNPAQLDSIFSAFVTTKSNGMGLGLAICRQIVEYHGCKLFASSGSPGGAQFQVVLPIGSTEGASAKNLRRRGSGIPTIHVFLV